MRCGNTECMVINSLLGSWLEEVAVAGRVQWRAWLNFSDQREQVGDVVRRLTNQGLVHEESLLIVLLMWVTLMTSSTLSYLAISRLLFSDIFTIAVYCFRTSHAVTEFGCPIIGRHAGCQVSTLAQWPQVSGWIYSVYIYSMLSVKNMLNT